MSRKSDDLKLKLLTLAITIGLLVHAHGALAMVALH